jgi:hypothetical protein
VNHFIYDLYFMVDKPDAPQALEFDINQTFGEIVGSGARNVTSTALENGDIWNDAPDTGWTRTTIDCKPFPANTWIHLVWNLERVGNQAHYISLTVGDSDLSGRYLLSQTRRLDSGNN